jgi:hypothetical protein
VGDEQAEDPCKVNENPPLIHASSPLESDSLTFCLKLAWLVAHGEPPAEIDMVTDAETVTILDDGEIGFKGTYTVFRDTLEVSDGVDEVTARWSFDGKQLRFTEVTPENTPFEVVWESHAWEKVGQQ